MISSDAKFHVLFEAQSFYILDHAYHIVLKAIQTNNNKKTNFFPYLVLTQNHTSCNSFVLKKANFLLDKIISYILAFRRKLPAVSIPNFGTKTSNEQSKQTVCLSIFNVYRYVRQKKLLAR